MSKKETVKVKINNEALAKANGVKPGGTVDVEVRAGVPVSRYWRNRFRDAKIDESVEIVNTKPRKALKGGVDHDAS